MKRGLILIIALFFVPIVNAQSSCFISTNCTNATMMPNASLTYSGLGFVSTQGHFSTTGINFGFTDTYKLCCPNTVQIETTAPTSFRVSTINPPISNGSGHVQSNLYTDFIETINLNAECNVKATCTTEEICLFKMSNDAGSHVMDCYNANHPEPNSYALKMCCKLTELCYDGIDNDLDGKIDCADADCNMELPPFPSINEPGICFDTVSKQSSPFSGGACIENFTNYGNGSVLVNYYANCSGQIPPNPPPPLGAGYYYCADAGPNTDPRGIPEGTPAICCPVGTKGEWNSAFNEWRCTESAPCSDDCGFDFDFNKTQWYAKVFNWSAPNDWCNSQVPDLYNPDNLTSIRSSACCLIVEAGTINYFTSEDNVKIFG